MFTPLDVPFVADDPEKRPGDARRSATRPVEDGQAFDRRKRRAHNRRNASDTPGALIASCEHDRKNRHTRNRTFRAPSSPGTVPERGPRPQPRANWADDKQGLVEVMGSSPQRRQHVVLALHSVLSIGPRVAGSVLPDNVSHSEWPPADREPGAAGGRLIYRKS